MKDYLITDEIIFENKPIPVPYNYRISYKVSQLCLILHLCSFRSGSSLIKLHMISIALTNVEDGNQLIDYVLNKTTNYTLVRFDPAVNRAVKYAQAEGIIFQQQNGLFRLTSKGKGYVENLIKDVTLMINEKDFLNKISNKLSEEKIKWLMASWRFSNANH